MRRLVAVVCIAFMVHSSSLAVSPQEMLGNLKDQLYQALAVKTLDDTSITTFVMALPGIPLDPDIDLTQSDDRQALFTLLNFVPTGDITGQNSSDKMSDIYLRILDGSKSLVNNPAQPQLKAQADALESQWGAMNDAYFQYELAYLDAQRAANIAWAKNDPNKTVLQAKAQQAKVNWELSTKGNKTQYEQLRNQWKQLRFDMEGGEPWGARRAKYELAENVGFPVFTWPKYSSWAKDNGWMKVSFSSSNLQSSQHESTVQWGGGGGFFGFGARAAGSKTVVVSQENLDKLSIVFEVKRVLIDRQWLLIASVFRSRKWAWKDPAELPISYGMFNKQKHVFKGGCRCCLQA